MQRVLSVLALTVVLPGLGLADPVSMAEPREDLREGYSKAYKHEDHGFSQEDPFFVTEHRDFFDSREYGEDEAHFAPPPSDAEGAEVLSEEAPTPGLFDFLPWRRGQSEPDANAPDRWGGQSPSDDSDMQGSGRVYPNPGKSMELQNAGDDRLYPGARPAASRGSRLLNDRQDSEREMSGQPYDKRTRSPKDINDRLPPDSYRDGFNAQGTQESDAYRSGTASAVGDRIYDRQVRPPHGHSRGFSDRSFGAPPMQEDPETEQNSGPSADHGSKTDDNWNADASQDFGQPHPETRKGHAGYQQSVNGQSEQAPDADPEAYYLKRVRKLERMRQRLERLREQDPELFDELMYQLQSDAEADPDGPLSLQDAPDLAGPLDL